MRFIVECDGASGLVLMDQSFLGEMDFDLLRSMDFLLDYDGETELKFDFSSENWDIVRSREANAIKSYCNNGKMIICLYKDGDHQCDFHISDSIDDSSMWLYLPTGNLLAVTASELIQCIPYTDMEMEKIFELKLEKGWYAVSFSDEGKILCCQKNTPMPPFQNIKEY